MKSEKAFQTIGFETDKGWMALAWSTKGLVRVILPRSSQALALAGLPQGAIEPVPLPVGLDVDELVDKLCRYFKGEDVAFDEPLDPSLGTSFQRRVWEITRAIPRGQLRTYGSIARRAGSPNAARAVGQAMARNPWPVVVPCHRVIGHSGQLTGFGGGLALKRWMLETEGALVHLGGQASRI